MSKIKYRIINIVGINHNDPPFRFKIHSETTIKDLKKAIKHFTNDKGELYCSKFDINSKYFPSSKHLNDNDIIPDNYSWFEFIRANEKPFDGVWRLKMPKRSLK